MKEKIIQKIKNDIKSFYEEVGENFSSTRGSLWKDLLKFKTFVNNGDFILDLGCGNGRLLELFKNKNIKYFGLDQSRKLIELARKKYQSKDYQFVIGQAENLPFENNKFDKVFAIALLHHLPDQDGQKKVILEIKRVLKPKGLAILTVWNLRKTKFILKQIFYRLIYFKKFWGLSFYDFLIPWKTKNKIYWRYYRAFSKKELIKLIKKFNCQIVKIYHNKNIIIVFKKI